jgi:glutamyl-tRNA reductase
MRREILIVGLSHHTAPVEVREQFAVADGQFDDAYRQVLALPDVEEGVLLSTCNRVEVVASAGNPPAAASQIRVYLQQRLQAPAGAADEHLYEHHGREAVRHVFRVAASLDSMVVGEPQILGQIKEAYTRAATLGATGTILHRCFHKAFSVAKRVRAETGVASRAVSVSSAAVELARKIFDRFEDKTAMLIGAGRMSELAARHLLSHGVGEMMVANRTFDRAIELAREFGGTPVHFDTLRKYLHIADVVIGSTAADEFVLTPAMVAEVLRQRKQRPMFFIDLSVPRNFDPRINELDNVYLYDIDDLEGVIEGNREERQREAEKAEALVEREVDAFWSWLGTLDAVPTIVALREKIERIRKGELEKTLSALRDLDEHGRQALEAMTAAIVNKILHAPISKLKSQDDARTETYYLDAARHLFDLDDREDQ